MKLSFLKLTSLLLVIFISASSMVHNVAATENQNATVSSPEELQAWIDENYEIGGRVTLSASIVLEESLYPPAYLGEDAPLITIDTGSFGLIFDGGDNGDLANSVITGEGVDCPVVTIIDSVYFWGMNLTLHSLNVTSTGRGGIGGTAVEIVDSIPPRDTTAVGIIRSYGTGAVGLQLNTAIDLNCMDIAVEGTDSVAVSASDEITLTFCHLSAVGDNARIANRQITLDTCTAYPSAGDLPTITRRICDVFGNLNLVRKQSNTIPYINSEAWPRLLLVDQDGNFSTLDIYMPLDMSAMDTFDPMKTGVVTLPGILPDGLQGLGLEDEFSPAYSIHTRDAALPCITTFNFSDDWFNWGEDWYTGNTWVEAWTDYPEDLQEGYILWRSDDGGSTWYDITEAPNVKWGDISQQNSSSYHLFSLDLDGLQPPIQLQLELPGVGESNIIRINSFEGEYYGDNSGDRDGGDRKLPTNNNNNNNNNNNDNNNDALNPNDGKDSLAPGNPTDGRQSEETNRPNENDDKSGNDNNKPGDDNDKPGITPRPIDKPSIPQEHEDVIALIDSADNLPAVDSIASAIGGTNNKFKQIEQPEAISNQPDRATASNTSDVIPVNNSLKASTFTALQPKQFQMSEKTLPIAVLLLSLVGTGITTWILRRKRHG